MSRAVRLVTKEEYLGIVRGNEVDGNRDGDGGRGWVRDGQ